MRSRASLAVLLALGACAGGGGIRAASAFSYARYDATGMASWYGEEMGAGARTASGRRFDPDAITAAHRTLPLGQVVEVTALDTGRSALVLVDDRGPFHPDRLIDLSRGAAQLLGTHRRSVANVRVRAVTAAPGDVAALRAGRAVLVSPGRTGALAPLPTAGRYLVQVGSFANRDRANALAGRLDARVEPGPGVWRVRLGPFDVDGAQRARDAVASRGYGDAVLLPLR
jgi:rare lipoprotein A